MRGVHKELVAPAHDNGGGCVGANLAHSGHLIGARVVVVTEGAVKAGEEAVLQSAALARVARRKRAGRAITKAHAAAVARRHNLDARACARVLVHGQRLAHERRCWVLARFLHAHVVKGSRIHLTQARGIWAVLIREPAARGIDNVVVNALCWGLGPLRVCLAVLVAPLAQEHNQVVHLHVRDVKQVVLWVAVNVAAAQAAHAVGVGDGHVEAVAVRAGKLKHRTGASKLQGQLTRVCVELEQRLVGEDEREARHGHAVHAGRAGPKHLHHHAASGCGHNRPEVALHLEVVALAVAGQRVDALKPVERVEAAVVREDVLVARHGAGCALQLAGAVDARVALLTGWHGQGRQQAELGALQLVGAQGRAAAPWLCKAVAEGADAGVKGHGRVKVALARRKRAVRGLDGGTVLLSLRQHLWDGAVVRRVLGAVWAAVVLAGKGAGAVVLCHGVADAQLVVGGRQLPDAAAQQGVVCGLQVKVAAQPSQVPAVLWRHGHAQQILVVPLNQDRL